MSRGYYGPPPRRGGGYGRSRQPHSAFGRADRTLTEGGRLAGHGILAIVCLFLVAMMLPSMCSAAVKSDVVDPAAGGAAVGAVGGAGAAVGAKKLGDKLKGGGSGGGGGAAAGGGSGGAAAKKKGEEPPQTTTTTQAQPPPTTQPPAPSSRLSQRPLDTLRPPSSRQLGPELGPQPDRQPGVVINPVMPQFQTQ